MKYLMQKFEMQAYIQKWTCQFGRKRYKQMTHEVKLIIGKDARLPLS
jgi:hypothetical protein